MYSRKVSLWRERIVQKSPLQGLAQHDEAEPLSQDLLQQSIEKVKMFASSFMPSFLYNNYDFSDSEDDETPDGDCPIQTSVVTNITVGQAGGDSDVFSSAADSNNTSRVLEDPTGTHDVPRTVGTSSEELSEREQHERNFAPFRAIHNDRFRTQLRKFLDPTNYFNNPHIRVFRRTEGASHHVVMVQFGDPQFAMDYVFKIPVTGTRERWKEEHAYTMNCEAMLIKHIKKYTDVPVPEIKEVDLGFDNDLGAPYILMKKMRGKSAGYIWYDQGDEYALNSDSPSELIVQKRETFLKSLAGNMAQLQKLEFDKIGMPTCKDTGETVVGHSWETVDGNRKMRHVSASTQDWLVSGMEDRWPKATVEDVSDENDGEKLTEQDRVHHDRERGMRKIIDMIFRCPPFAAPEVGSESFVIRHPDLDLQNILTDEEGNVTGIIDWHEGVTAPRCVGSAALPLFLIQDWFPGFTLDDPPYMSWSLDHYRRIYAEAMQGACDDGMYTYKSAMYQAVYAATTRFGSAPDLVDKVLLQLPGLRLTDLDEFQERLGKGWPAAEKYLEKEIRDLFAPTTGTGIV